MPLLPAAAFLSTTSRIHNNTDFAIIDYYCALTRGGIVPCLSSLMSLQGMLADKLARKMLAGEQTDWRAPMANQTYHNTLETHAAKVRDSLQ